MTYQCPSSAPRPESRRVQGPPARFTPQETSHTTRPRQHAPTIVRPNQTRQGAQFESEETPLRSQVFGSQQSERRNSGQQQTKQVTIVRKYIREELPSQRFAVDLLYKNQIVSALLDSGADASVVSTRWANKHQELKRKISSQILTSAFGDPLKNPEEIEIPLKLPQARNQVTITCAVVPLTGHADILLSDDDRHKLGIDWPDGKNKETQESHEEYDPQSRYKVVADEPVIEQVSHTTEIDKISKPMPLQVEQLLLRFSEIFVQKLDYAGAAHVEPIEIHVPTGKQIYVPPRQIKPTILDAFRKEIDDMHTAGVIEPSHAKHNTPLLAVMKSNGKLRICADLRALNRICEKFEWEFPRLDLALTKMTTSTIFSKIDLTSGFWQLPLSQNSRDYTTFRFDGKTWRFTVVPFGWKGAPAAFQSTMDSVLQQGIHSGFLTVYMDDILVHSRNTNEHVKHLNWTLSTLRKVGFKLNPDKCIFGVN